MTQIILRNQAECKRCGHILKSTHVHDIWTHSCHRSVWFMVDGGLDYLRRGWGGPGMSRNPYNHYIDRSIWVDSRIYDNCLRGY